MSTALLVLIIVMFIANIFALLLRAAGHPNWGTAISATPAAFAIVYLTIEATISMPATEQVSGYDVSVLIAQGIGLMLMMVLTLFAARYITSPFEDKLHARSSGK